MLLHARDICNKISYAPDSLCTPQNTQYGYDVEIGSGLAFVVIFGLIAILHLFQLIRYRKRAVMYMILAIICALGEAGGWAFRANSSFNEFDFTGYVAQLVLLIFSPVFISATTYVIFCRIMDELGHHWSLIPRNWYIGTFVTGDVLSLIVQSAGGGMSATATTTSSANTGKSIMIAGVAIQVIVTCFFTFLLVIYLIRRSSSQKTIPTPKLTKVMLWSIVVATLAIMVRCIFRLVEMSQGWTGYLARHSSFLVLFDGVPLTVATLILAIVHPGRFLSPEVGEKGAAGVDHLIA